MIRKTAKHGSAFGKTLEKLVAIYTAPFFKGDFSILFALFQGNGLLFKKRLCDINQFDNRNLELKLKPMEAPVIQTFAAVYFENCLIHVCSSASFHLKFFYFYRTANLATIR